MELLPAPFGKYFLTDKIATGGMAEIFAAKLIGPGGFEKPLIIKQIHPELSGDPQFVDMFVAEAKILVSLSHGNIVPVYELGVVDDIYFIAMEYIDGTTLRDLEKGLTRAGTTMGSACAALIMAKVLDGLAYAHRKGVIHRDLSPRNVMLSREGEVKLVDFGIAVREEHLEADSGKLVGSYPYMSPEQVRGQPLSVKSDIFSAGILLWEMLTGQDLFRRPDGEETLRAVTDAAIEAPSARCPGVSEALDRACLRALERDPARRFDSAREFARAVNRALYAHEDAPGAPELARLVAMHCPPERRRPRPASVGTRPMDAARGDDASVHTRRLPGPRAQSQHTRPLHPDGPAGDGGRATTARLMADGPDDRDGPADPIDHTRPLAGRKPRRPRGKRAQTVRTFATRPEFQEVLARATPILPLTAIRPEGEADEQSSAAAAVATTQQDATTDIATTEEDAAATTTTAARPGDGAIVSSAKPALASGAELVAATVPVGRRRRNYLVAAVLVAASACALAAFALIDGREASTSPGPATGEVPKQPRMPDPGPPAPRPVSPRPAPPVEPVPSPRTAPAHIASEPAAATAPSVRKKRPRPSRVKPVAAAPGTLKVGARPWAEVYIDGTLLGRAPNTWPVTAGKHKVEVVFPVAGHERRERRSVVIRAGEETSLGVIDFTGNAASP